MKIQNPKSKIQNYNSKLKNILDFHKSPVINHKSAFTLIELLVVVTLMSVVGVITAQVFVLGTRSQAKSDILKEVKQNGDYIEYVVENMVRNAVDIVDISASSCNKNSHELTILNPDGYETTFDCETDDAIIASRSGLSNPSLHSSRVRISNCNFRVVCPTPAINPKYVFFTFSICQMGAEICPSETGTFAENRASIDYQTTVALRNYQ